MAPRPMFSTLRYRVEGSQIVQTDSRRSDGTWVRYAFNDGRTIAETWGSEGYRASHVPFRPRSREPGSRVLEPDVPGPNRKAVAPHEPRQARPRGMAQEGSGPDALLFVAERRRARHSVRSGSFRSESRTECSTPDAPFRERTIAAPPQPVLPQISETFAARHLNLPPDLCQPRCSRLAVRDCSLRGLVWIAGRFSHSLWRRQRSRKPKSPRLNQRRRPAARPAFRGRSGAVPTGTSRPRPRASRTHGPQRDPASCGSGPLEKAIPRRSSRVIPSLRCTARAGRRSSSRRTPKPVQRCGNRRRR